MNEQGTVNTQLTDAITQTNSLVLGTSSAQAMSILYEATAQALANASHNATMAQQQSNILAQAVTTQGVNMLYSIKF